MSIKCRVTLRGSKVNVRVESPNTSFAKAELDGSGLVKDSIAKKCKQLDNFDDILCDLNSGKTIKDIENFIHESANLEL